jgi:hypothetical protein
VNKVVARFANGRIIKGTTTDFFPNKDRLHVSVFDAPDGDQLVCIRIEDLKAIFFVKDFEGDPLHDQLNEIDPSRHVLERPIRVTFKDGEVLVGVTSGYRPERPGFFLEPVDPESNIERCFVVTAAAAEVTFI